jgi:small subunit ribosomal protein S1
MTSPDTPPQNPQPGASEPALDTSESRAAAVPVTNGHPTAAPEAEPEGRVEGVVEPHEDPVEGAVEPHEDPVEGAAEPHDEALPGEAPAEKKRRRRRRKRKTGTQPAAGEGSATEGAEQATVEPGAEDGVDSVSEKIDRREEKRRKERKPGPPRERPPVNGGDIVFGKIIEVTQEAILVDIPGKAHAIFDRREMLLPDDDEPTSRRRTGAVDAPPEVTPTVQEGELHQTDAAPPAVEGAPAAPAEAEEVAVPAQAEEPVPPPADASLSAPVPSDPPKEPKVPRVILEVGADFIAVVHNDGARGGLVVLTHHPNRAERAKPLVEKAFNEKATIEALVTGVIKGGIEVDVDGLRAFAPGSHVDLRLGADLSHLVAKRLPFLVTQYAKRGRDIVLSRKAILEEEARRARTEALERLKVGEELDGVVRSVVPFGAFVDVGGIEGLVPLQEMSHNRADGPSDIFKAGESTRVKVIKIDDKGKVWLSHKATIPDPWQQVAQKYATGTRHVGKVVRLQPFGAFVELEPGVDGLVHTQDLSLKRIEGPGDVVKAGDAIDVVVAHVDPSQHKIALHPAPQGDAVAEALQKVAPHKAVKAKVVNIESGGLLVRILGVTGRNARGYVTAAGTGTPRGTELRKAFNVGQEIEAKVIEMDPRRGEVKLSIKALGEDQERSAYQQYRQQLKAEARFTFGDLLAKKGKA